MYIKVSDLCLIVLGALIFIAILYLISVLKKLSSFIDNLNNFFSKNSKSLNVSISNIKTITDNFKDISEAVTDTTADALIAKDNIKDNINTIRDIINIILKVSSYFIPILFFTFSASSLPAILSIRLKIISISPITLDPSMILPLSIKLSEISIFSFMYFLSSISI